MEETFKFPSSGYDVIVVRKKDILECINDNIIDKELALEIITRCEIDAINFLKQGRWAGIPFIGNIRIPKNTSLINSEEQQQMLNEAKEKFNKEEYVLFRRKLNADNEKRIREERNFNYIVSMMANRYPKLFKKLTNNKGDRIAKFIIYTLYNLNVVNDNHITQHYNYYGQFGITN